MFSLLIIFILDIACLLLAPPYMDKIFMGIILVLAAVTIVIFATDKRSSLDEYLHKYHIRHSVLFIFCFCVVFFQRDIDYVLGIIDNSLLYENYWVDQSVVCKCLALSNCCLCCFVIGYNIFQRKLRINLSLNATGFEKWKKMLFYIILFLEIIAIFKAPKEMDRNSYSENSGWVSYYVNILLYTIIINFSIKYVNNKSHNINWFKFFKIPLLLSSLFVFCVITFSGSRSNSIKIISFLLISYIFCLRGKINYKKIAVLGLIGLFSMSMIGIIRSMNQRNTSQAYEFLLQNKTISPFTSELAGSVKTLHLAVANCPEKYPYDWGYTFFPQYLKLIPGSFGIYKKVIAGDDLKNSAEIITEMYFGPYPPSWSWGLGSSVIADIYISFGSIGCCIIFLLFGYFFKYMEYIAFVRPSSIYLLTLSFLCFSSTIFISRSSFSDLLLLWPQTCFVIYLIRYFKGKNILSKKDCVKF